MTLHPPAPIEVAGVSKRFPGAVNLVVWCSNQRRLCQQRYPTYHKHVIDFLSPTI